MLNFWIIGILCSLTSFAFYVYCIKNCPGFQGRLIDYALKRGEIKTDDWKSLVSMMLIPIFNYLVAIIIGHLTYSIVAKLNGRREKDMIDILLEKKKKTNLIIMKKTFK